MWIPEIKKKLLFASALPYQGARFVFTNILKKDLNYGIISTEKLMETKFFNKKNINIYYDEIYSKFANEFSHMTDKDILSYDEEDLVNYFYAKHEPEILVINDLNNPELKMERKSVVETRRNLFDFYGNNPTCQVEVEYMFWYYKLRLTGNIQAIYIHPNNFSFTMGKDYENIDINKSSKDEAYDLTVTIKIELQEASNPNIKELVYKKFEESLSLFQKNLAVVNSEIYTIRTRLKNDIKKLVERRINIVNASNLIYAKFAIPVVSKESVKKPIVVKKKIIQLPNKRHIENEEYYVEYSEIKEINEHIYKYCSSMERNPGAYKNNSEEDIRFTILSSLNTRFSNATGETFSHKGKTDIFIGKLDKMAYIAECKIWSDKTKLEKAVGQLLSYTTWKECAGTLLVFNKTVKDFTKLLKNIETIIKRIDQVFNFKKIKDSVFEFQIKKQGTEDTMTITLMVFDYNS